MGDFTEDTAFRALVVIGLVGILFWSTFGHAIAYYEDSLVATYGPLAFDEGFKMAHLHSMVNSSVTLAAAVALPLITSIGRRLKTALATVLGLSLVTWNATYLYAAMTTTAFTTTATPTPDELDSAFEAARTAALQWIGIPISWLASVVGGILFLALIYDLARRKTAKT